MQDTLQDLRSNARRLRDAIRDMLKIEISHSHALELVAKERGFRNWDTAYAAVGSQQFPNLVPAVTSPKRPDTFFPVTITKPKVLITGSTSSGKTVFSQALTKAFLAALKDHYPDPQSALIDAHEEWKATCNVAGPFNELGMQWLCVNSPHPDRVLVIDEPYFTRISEKEVFELSKIYGATVVVLHDHKSPLANLIYETPDWQHVPLRVHGNYPQLESLAFEFAKQS